MGFLDKIKQQASEIADKAQDLGKKGQDRVEQVQGKAKANSLLRELGTVVYAERTGKASATTSAQISRVMSELGQLEATGVPIPSPSTSSVDLTTSSTVVTTEPATSTTGTTTTSTTTTGTPVTGRDVTITDVS